MANHNNQYEEQRTRTTTKNKTNVNEQRIRRTSNTPQQPPRTTHGEQDQEQMASTKSNP